MKKKVVPIILAILVIGGASFYGGMAYAKSKNVSARSMQGNLAAGNFRRSADGQANGQTGTNFLNGNIISKDQDNLTIKLGDGGSKIVFVSGTTQIMKMASSTLDALQVGDSLMITGTNNQDGSVTAQTIQLRPQMGNPSNPNPQNP